MQDVEIIGMLKSYINQTLVGMGALKGAPCTVKSVVDSGLTHTVTLEWTDNNGDTQTTDFVITDGTNGTNGTNGTDGISPEITVKTSTDNTYILTITDAQGSFDTPNLKGGGSGGASAVSDLTDVTLTSLSDGQILKWDNTASKWVNANLPTVDSALNQSSTNAIQNQAVYAGLADKVDKVAGKGLSTNDYSDADATKLSGIEAGAEVNEIDTVKVNGTALTPDENKAVDISAVASVSVNGVSQTVTSGAVDIDVATNLITETQWTAVNALYA